MLNLEIVNWWTDLSAANQVYWIICIPSTLIFIYQIIFSFIKKGILNQNKDENFSNRIKNRIFIWENILPFFTLFSWVGLACFDAGYSLSLTFSLSIIGGMFMSILIISINHFIDNMGENDKKINLRK